MASTIEFRQTNPPEGTNPHLVTNPGLSPLAAGNFFQQITVESTIRNLLFEMRKDGEVYWVGAAIQGGGTDFTKAQVFFHPTVINGGNVHAADRDYPKFTGGWSGSIQRYVRMQGGLLASVRATPLIVPFMTTASGAGKGPAYMFATRPIETLNAILTAFQKEVTGKSDPVSVAQIAVSSFSSGIHAMRHFIKTYGSSGLIVEATDFDGPLIKGNPRVLPHAPGAIGRVFSQVPPPRPTPGWISLPAWKFKKITAFRDKGAHAQIGWMTFHLAGMLSAIN
jgi:hypothetical protein